jgi:hypothetical protein
MHFFKTNLTLWKKVMFIYLTRKLFRNLTSLVGANENGVEIVQMGVKEMPYELAGKMGWNKRKK